MKNKFSNVILITFVCCLTVPVLAHSHESKIDSILVTFDSFPSSNEIIEIELFPDINQGQELNSELFKELIDSVIIISTEDPILQEWHYAPWYKGSFRTEGSIYNFILYLGGLGVLKTLEDLKGAFMLNLKTINE